MVWLWGMAVAALVAVPFGVADSGTALIQTWVLVAGLGAALLSSVHAAPAQTTSNGPTFTGRDRRPAFESQEPSWTRPVQCLVVQPSPRLKGRLGTVRRASFIAFAALHRKSRSPSGR